MMLKRGSKRRRTKAEIEQCKNLAPKDQRQSEDDEARSKRVDSMLAQVKKTK